MATARRKFGAFGGVFTPAILTILGVIMYLRLPWIVGNGGFWLTVGVIIAAHVVSISTGLSVSSIATDKKVKAGGSYYILSRSLGLPIGGTLGIALFVGLSFSVSLYLIGFSESFLTTVFGEAPTKDEIRITGSITLLVVTIVTFISTSLAIKTQFIIMALIVLSLGSILIGNSDTPAPEAMHMDPLPDGAGFVVLFGIFFPAVTGFEAGVSMSGDLRDPKKDIPGGTLAAIGVGLVVYIGLAAFLAYRIPADQLVDNSKVLLDNSLVWQLVVAGIWGATISSALGSILGAPRILQACSQDRIGPRFFGKGHGVDNEPRNALLLTFLIAEAGILIGELNAIAEIVSMFFLASYAFLNVSAAIESWASPDFRPDFKVPRLVSIIGGVTCVILMIQLNFVAMVGAVVLMSLLFLLLKRQELNLEQGDTWAGVWSSLVRNGLERLSRTAQHQRNWRPNMLVFTDEDSRGPLVGLGRDIVSNRGVLTEFELVDAETPELRVATVLATDDEDEASEELSGGLFRRRVETDDRFGTIASISRFHGLSGLEPNTVMVDWGLLRADPARAATVVRTVGGLEHNLLIAIFPSAYVPASGNRVDVWWRGPGTNLALGLALVRFITSTDRWRDASVRFLVASADPGLQRTLRQRIVSWLADARVDAEVRVVDAPPAGESWEQMVTTASADADLTIAGLPDPPAGEASENLAPGIGIFRETGRPTLLVRASPSGFRDPFPEIDPSALVSGDAEEARAEVARPERPKTLDLPDDTTLARYPLDTYAGVSGAMGEFHREVMGQLVTPLQTLVDEVERLVKRANGQLEKASTVKPLARRQRVVSRVEAGTTEAVGKLLAEFERAHAGRQRETLSVGLGALSERLQEVVGDLEETVTISYLDEDDPQPGFWDRLAGRTGIREVPLRAHVAGTLDALAPVALSEALTRLQGARHRSIAGMEELVGWALGSIAASSREVLTAEEVDVADHFAAMREGLADRVESWRETEEALLTSEREALASLGRDTAQAVTDILENPLRKRRARTRPDDEGPFDPDDFAEAHGPAFDLLTHLVTRARLDVSLKALHHELREAARRTRAELERLVPRGVIAELKAFVESLGSLSEAISEHPAGGVSIDSGVKTTFDDRRITGQLLEAIEHATSDLPEVVETLTEASFQALEEGRQDDVEPVTIAVKRLVAFVLETELVGALQPVLTHLERATERAANVSREVTRLVSFEGAADAEVPGLLEERLDLVRGGKERVAQALADVEEAWKEVPGTFSKLLEDVIDKTAGGEFASSAGQLRRFIRTYERQQLFTRVSAFAERVREGFRRGLVDLTYSWNRGILLARKLQDVRDPETSRVEQTLELRRISAPSVFVEEELPIVYRQIFVGRPAADPAYWLGMDDELERAEEALESHIGGRPGALLVTGPPGSGRTALAQRIAAEFFDRNTTYHLNAPEGGSIDPQRFENALLAALGVTSDVDQALRTLPQGSALIIHDLELWWERSDQGQVVIDRLCELIDAHGSRCLFVLVTNEPFVRLASRLSHLGDQLLATIPVRPLDAYQLRQAIMRRHSATGLGLRLEGDYRDPSEWKMARLFSGLFDFCGGYVGSALTAWIGHIERMDGDTVILRRPQTPDLACFDALSPEWTALLIEIVLHKRIGMDRLERVTGLEPRDLRMGVHALERSGLITRRAGVGAWELDPYMRHHVIRWLSDKELI